MYSKLKKIKKRGRGGEKREILLYANYERIPVYTCSVVSFNFKRNSKQKENRCLWNAGPIIHWEEGTRRLNLFEVSENQQHRSALGSLQLWQGCCLQVTISVLDKEENRVTSVPGRRAPTWNTAVVTRGDNEAPRCYRNKYSINFTQQRASLQASRAQSGSVLFNKYWDSDSDVLFLWTEIVLVRWRKIQQRSFVQQTSGWSRGNDHSSNNLAGMYLIKTIPQSHHSPALTQLMLRRWQHLDVIFNGGMKTHTKGLTRLKEGWLTVP